METKNWVSVKEHQKLLDKTNKSLNKEKGYKEAVKLIKKLKVKGIIKWN